MFDHGGMTAPITERAADLEGRMRQVRDLQQRVRQVQDACQGSTPSQGLETLPAVAEMLPGGALRSGSTYAVQESTTLAMAMMAGPSAAGSWCGVVGIPTFGAEAAAAAGIDLSRTILVPDPGDQWLSVTAALVDVLTVIVIMSPARVTGGEASRLSARLRQHGSTLIALGGWPRAQAQLSISDSTWVGLSDGYGHLSARQVTVTAVPRSGRARRTRLWLPSPDQQVQAVKAPAVSGTFWSSSCGVSEPKRHSQRAAEEMAS